MAILTNNCYHSEVIHINSPLEVIAVTTYAPKKITICSIYLPPKQNIWKQNLTSITSQLPKLFIICGDFNAHNIIWGSACTKPKGRLVEEAYKNEIILNTGSPTHLSLSYGTLSAIDLTICSPDLSPSLYWEVLPDLHGSNHFLILTTNYASRPQDIQKSNKIKWNLKQANWD